MLVSSYLSGSSHLPENRAHSSYFGFIASVKKPEGRSCFIFSVMFLLELVRALERVRSNILETLVDVELTLDSRLPNAFNLIAKE